MIKDKMNYKLVNCALVMTIIFLLYKTGDLWLGIVNTIFSISIPFIVSFVIAYALYPIVKFLVDKKIPKIIAITLVLIFIVGILGIFVMIVVPLLFNQLGSLFNGIIVFLNELASDYGLNFYNLKDTLNTDFNYIITSIGTYLSSGAVNALNISISLLSKIFICFAASMYMLADMDRIRNGIRKYLNKKSKKIYKYVKLLDCEMHSYLSGFIKIMIISLFEYTIAYAIIGHPNAVLLGCLAMLGCLIPYFGGMINNTVAAITAFVISPALFIKTIILFVILSTIDGYLINPLVYGKTNKIHPLIIIISVFAGGVLFGITGIIVSLPCAIIVLTTIKYFKKDMLDKIEEVKEIIKD